MIGVIVTFPAGIEVGNIAGFVSRSQTEGLSARAGLASFRAAGGAIRDSRWYNTWGEVAASKAGQIDTGAYPINSIPDRSLYSTWSAGKAGRFATQVRVFVRERGFDAVEMRQMTYVSDIAHSAQTAMDSVRQSFTENETEYPSEIQGMYVSGFYIQTGMEE